MKKRKFIQTTSALALGAVLAPMAACKSELKEAGKEALAETMQPASSFTLPDLPYSFDALSPNIDAMTMEIHHDKHHAGYVRKFNTALEGSALSGQTIEQILSTIGSDDTGLRNNGGGHFNHSLFWSVMSPKGGGTPTGDLSDAINTSFGSFEKFKEVFSAAASTRFGSGWAWLTKGTDNKLFVHSSPNQDNPLMTKISDDKGTPILGLDVWEHAYYLNYQNRRGDYIGNFFNVVNWNEVAKRLG